MYPLSSIRERIVATPIFATLHPSSPRSSRPSIFRSLTKTYLFGASRSRCPAVRKDALLSCRFSCIVPLLTGFDTHLVCSADDV